MIVHRNPDFEFANRGLNTAIYTPRSPTPVGEKAQAIVEFALAVPLVMVMVLALFEFSRLIFVYTTITSASREAARYGAGVGSTDAGTMLYNDCNGIKAAAIRVGRFAGLNESDIHIYHDSGPDTTQIEYCTNPSDTVHFGPDDRISVKVDAFYDPIMPLVNIPPFTLHSQNSHTILLGANVVALPQPVNVGGGQTCDVSPYKITVSNPSGPEVQVFLLNTSDTNLTITNLLLVWDTSGSPVLQSINGIPGANPPSSPANLGPSYSTPLEWPFLSTTDATPQPTPTPSFTITFSKALKNNLIIRLTVDLGGKTCAFGQ